MVYSIVYLSSSRILPDDTELEQIIEQSRSKNAMSNITGALLSCNGNIIQVLEGEKEVVSSLFVKIQRDHRHAHVIPLFQGDVPRRSFEKWAMGYSTPSTRNMQELREQLPFIDNPDLPINNGSKVLTLLQIFFKNNHRN